MRLSEAIRLGAMMNPKGQGHLRDWYGNTCALGAACDAVGMKISVGQQSPNNATFKRWPILRRSVKCPVGVGWKASVSVTIQSLNDRSNWTREQIADWVESIEDELSTTVEPTQAADAVGQR